MCARAFIHFIPYSINGRVAADADAADAAAAAVVFVHHPK